MIHKYDYNSNETLISCVCGVYAWYTNQQSVCSHCLTALVRRGQTEDGGERDTDSSEHPSDSDGERDLGTTHKIELILDWKYSLAVGLYSIWITEIPSAHDRQAMVSIEFAQLSGSEAVGDFFCREHDVLTSVSEAITSHLRNRTCGTPDLAGFKALMADPDIASHLARITAVGTCSVDCVPVVPIPASRAPERWSGEMRISVDADLIVTFIDDGKYAYFNLELDHVEERCIRSIGGDQGLDHTVAWLRQRLSSLGTDPDLVGIINNKQQ